MKKLDADKHYKGYLYMGYIWVVIVLIMLFLTSCYGTYYLTDSEYSDVRESHASITYYDNQVYWGWDNGYYYYYYKHKGKPAEFDIAVPFYELEQTEKLKAVKFAVTEFSVDIDQYGYENAVPPPDDPPEDPPEDPPQDKCTPGMQKKGLC